MKCGGIIFNRHKWYKPIKRLGLRICKGCGITERLGGGSPEWGSTWMSCDFPFFKEAIENYEPPKNVVANSEALEWLSQLGENSEK